jgi:hypothetical protein
MVRQLVSRYVSSICLFTNIVKIISVDLLKFKPCKRHSLTLISKHLQNIFSCNYSLSQTALMLSCYKNILSQTALLSSCLQYNIILYYIILQTILQISKICRGWYIGYREENLPQKKVTKE